MQTDSPPSPKETRPERPASQPWALKIGQVAGIPIYLHLTFLLLILFLGFRSIPNLLFILSLFACVALHELGHALVALRYKIPVADITLYPIGGIARIEKQPEPSQELWIAIAGPMVNVAIAAALWIYLQATGHLGDLIPNDFIKAGWVRQVLTANVTLAVFNLIPAFPMDGGRILRALLALRLPLERATSIAASIGQLIAIVAGIYGFLTPNLMLLLVAFFVYLGAGQEVMIVRRENLIRDVSVREAMLSEVHTLPHGSTYREAADLLLATSQQDFPVALGDEVYGLLSRDSLLRGLATEGPEAYIASGMARDFIRANPDDDLKELLPQIQGGAGPALVFEGERMVGMVTTENLMEFLVIRQITAAKTPTVSEEKQPWV